MLRFIFTRLSLIIPTFLGMTLLAFFLIRMVPGDPIETMAGERGIDPVRHAQLLKEFGLDKPVMVQYGIYIVRVLKGDLGKSIVTQEPVLREFLTLFPATIELAVCAILFALLIGIPAGILAAVKRNSILDHGVMGVSLTGYSMPIFWWGLLLILLFSVELGWTPVSGRLVGAVLHRADHRLPADRQLLSDDKGAFWSAASHLILPMIVLGTNPLAVIARMTRSAMLEVLGEDYIRTARAKGISNLRVVALHALRNALIPVVTVIGLQVGVLFTGAILTETIFSWPGVGKWLIEAISRRDYPCCRAASCCWAPSSWPSTCWWTSPTASSTHASGTSDEHGRTLKTPPRPPAAPPHPLREFWNYFSANNGAVIGLVVVVGVLLARCSRRCWRRMRPTSPTTRCSSSRRPGRKAAPGATRWAPTPSAATSSRA
jgi:dipeptide transport system permease protein